MARKLISRALRPDPLTVPPFDVADQQAIRSMSEGTASPDQQRRAFDWIVKKLAGIGSISFDPESARATDFLEGRRFVGSVLIKFATSPVEMRNDHGRSDSADPAN